MEPVKVVIEVRGGCVVSVLSGVPLDVRVVDYDTHDDADGDPIFGRLFSDDSSLQSFINASSTKDQL